jgi:hypothetical protein
VSPVRLFLLCALAPILVSLTSCRTVAVAYAPPKVDCEALAPPRVAIPIEPALDEKSVTIWQLYAFALQEYAGDLLGQRVETAVCVKDLRDKGVIR